MRSQSYDFPVTLYVRGPRQYRRIEAQLLIIQARARTYFELQLDNEMHDLSVQYLDRHDSKWHFWSFNPYSVGMILDGWGYPESVFKSRPFTSAFAYEWYLDFVEFADTFTTSDPAKVLFSSINYDFSGGPQLAESPQTFREGAPREVTLTVYERSAQARKLCIEHYGPRCFLCGFDFSVTYGEAGRGYIHTHHLTPFSSIKAEYMVDPIQDMRPVCPNCHAIIHRRNPPYSLEEMMILLANQG